VYIKNLNLKLLTVYSDLGLGGIYSSNYNNIRLQSRVSQDHPLNDLLIRPYCTESLSSSHTPLKLNSLFITGFTDGEGSFSISVRDINKDTKKGKIFYVFSIVLHKKDESILRNIPFTLGIGKIYTHAKQGVQFRVESKKELLILIEHFDKYPLITKKK
jgi:hypothetical protein